MPVTLRHDPKFPGLLTDPDRLIIRLDRFGNLPGTIVRPSLTKQGRGARSRVS
jgi:hypothetical protein